MPPKLVPTSSPASARKKRALPRRPAIAIRSADQLKVRPMREGRHQRRRDPGRGENQVRRHPEQPGGVVGQDDFLVQQPDEVAVGLQYRRPLPAQQPRLDLADEAGEQRRQQQHEQHLAALDERSADRHSATASEQADQADEDQAR